MGGAVVVGAVGTRSRAARRWAAARQTDRATSEPAWLAGAITATCDGYFAMARLALPDLPLAFFITLAIWSALERRWLLAGVAAGLGLLMKGPIALVVPGLVLVPIWWRERHRLPFERAADLVLAAVVCAAVVAAVVRGDDLRARHGVPPELLRRRQPGAIRDRSFQ